MRRTLLAAFTMLTLAAGLAHANPPVGIPQNRKVISMPARKGAIARYLNKVEGVKMSFAQRGGQLGGFQTVGGSTQLWSTHRTVVPAPPNVGPGVTPTIWPPPRTNMGTIEIAKSFRGQRVTIFPVIMAQPSSR